MNYVQLQIKIVNNSMDLISISCLAGFIGDTLLQIGAKQGMGGSTNWGLKDYFKQHGQVESTFIAGGMMSVFYVIYIYIIPLPINYLFMSIYAVFLDLFFRKTMFFPSLKGYYNYFGYFGSALWAIIPALIPLIVYDIIHKQYPVLL